MHTYKHKDEFLDQDLFPLEDDLFYDDYIEEDDFDNLDTETSFLEFDTDLYLNIMEFSDYKYITKDHLILYIKDVENPSIIEPITVRRGRKPAHPIIKHFSEFLDFDDLPCLVGYRFTYDELVTFVVNKTRK